MTTIDIKEFKRLKKAKIIVEELNTIIKILDLAIHGLSIYSKYVAISEIMPRMVESRKILHSQRIKMKNIVKNKGKMDDKP